MAPRIPNLGEKSEVSCQLYVPAALPSGKVNRINSAWWIYKVKGKGFPGL